MENTILVTGGAGFIGSALIRFLINETSHKVVNLDKLTYAGNLESLDSVSSSPRYTFLKGDICDKELVNSVFREHKPAIVMHLAAESHVDRSITDASDFIQTNVIGTYTLLEAARSFYNELDDVSASNFRFHHISTDEVYGDLGPEGFFTEETSYKPSSPYSASKASSDHLVRAWGRTYGLPIVVTNCSNNYGPFHYPEKLIPLTILNALAGKELPIYGDGSQIRDWLFVEDHARALYHVATNSLVGNTYNIGGFNEKTNLEVVHQICDLLEELAPENNSSIKSNKSHGFRSLIKFVKDRPGHDVRYAIDANKIRIELGWTPQETFESGLRKTVEWYLKNDAWCQSVLNKVK